MSEATIGKITSQITKMYESTSSLVGSDVVKIKQNGKAMFLIAGTEFVLTKEECKQWIKQKLIVPSVALNENHHGKHSIKKTSGYESSPRKISYDENDPITQKFEKVFEESTFFNEPTSKFELEIPKHAQLLDFKENVSIRLDKLFGSKKKRSRISYDEGF